MNKMTANKTVLRVMRAVISAMTLIGCEDDPAIETDYVQILGVTPGALLDGVEQQVAVSVEYYAEDQRRLVVAFNTVADNFRVYRTYGSIDITEKGSGNHTFNVTV